jgi:Concanavalin A-like lectin/glucanases superfamily/tRNA_anti-like
MFHSHLSAACRFVFVLGLCLSVNSAIWAQKKNVESIAADKLTKAFADNEDAARKKYAGLAPLVVEGTVVEVEKLKSGNIYVHLKGHADAWKVTCDFEAKDAKAVLESVKPNQKISVAGAGYGPVIPREILIAFCKIVPGGGVAVDPKAKKEQEPITKKTDSGVPDEKVNVVKPGAPAELAGLLAYWKLDEGEGTTAQDASANKLKATLHGGRWVAGANGTGLQFERDEYLDYGDSPRLNFKAGAPFTFAGWVKTTAQRGAVVSQRDSKDGGAVIDITLDEGKLAGLVRADGREFGQHAGVTGRPIDDGQWHHFALTRDTGRTIELFIDGESQGKSTGADAGGAITTDLRTLGLERYWVRVGFPNPQFVGAVDEFCVFDRALTGEQIRKLAGPPRRSVAQADPPKGAAARYAADGITFDYPKHWTVNAEKPGGMVSLTVQNDKGTQVLIQLHPNGADPKSVRTQMESVFRKAFEGKLVPGSEKAVKRKLAGAERDGMGMDFELAKDVVIHFDFFAFPLAAKSPVVCIAFQHGIFDAEATAMGFDVIAASLAESRTGPKK